jgi:hypothetical protein
MTGVLWPPPLIERSRRRFLRLPQIAGRMRPPYFE